MNVTIYQINGRVLKLSNVYIIMNDEDAHVIKVWIRRGEYNEHLKFNSDLIALIKIGGQHEYKKR